MADIISQTNQKIFGFIKGGATKMNLMRVIGWLLFIIIVVAGAVVIYLNYRNKKQYNKKITLLELVGDYFQPALEDRAKVVKIGTGGFEILYLKKLKTWKVAYGGRVGMHKYYFFKSPDGYWYNSMFYGKIEEIDKHGGLIPVVTANPLMRGQYTALEKQIDALHSDKKSFMEKYGTWVLAISFVLIAGFMLYLCYKEFATAMGGLHETVSLESDILKKLNQFACATLPTNETAGGISGGLIPIT
jgi:hypothetical protein